MKTRIFLFASIGLLLMNAPANAHLGRWKPIHFRNDSIGRCDDYRNTPDVQIANCEKALLAFRFHDKGMLYILNDLADAFWNKHDFASSVAIYTKTLEIADKSEAANQICSRGYAYLAWDKVNLAEKDFQTGIRNYNESYCFAGLANMAERAGNYVDALKNYNIAISLRPSELWLLTYRAQLYAEMSEYDKAMQDDEVVVENYKTDGFSYDNRCLHRAIANRDLDAALDDCNKGLGFLPDDADGLDDRGFVRYRQGRWPDAIADYTLALTHDPYDASSLYMRGLCELREGQKDKGQADVAHAKSLYPTISADYATFGILP